MKTKIIIDVFDSGRKFWIKKRYPTRVEIGMFNGDGRFSDPYFYFKYFNVSDHGSIYFKKKLKFFMI